MNNIGTEMSFHIIGGGSVEGLYAMVAIRVHALFTHAHDKAVLSNQWYTSIQVIKNLPMQ